MTNGKNNSISSKRKAEHAENKGVTVSSDTFKDCQQKDEATSANYQNDISISNVREDLQNVIEMMGPTTPHLHQNVSSDADNEDSIYSTTSVYSSVLKIHTVKKNDVYCDDQNLVSCCDDSQMTAYNYSDISEQEIMPTNEVAIQATDIPLQINYQQTQMCTPFNCPQLMNLPVVIMPPNDAQKETQSKPNLTAHRPREKRSFLSRFVGINDKKDHKSHNLELYKINIQQPEGDHSPPRRLVFDLIEDMPKKDTKTIGTNTKHCNVHSYGPRKYSEGIHKHQINIPMCNKGNISYKHQINRKITKTPDEESSTERIDIYYFDHGNSAYYRTTDSPPVMMTELLAERTEQYTTRFWAQVFGTIQIGVSFVTSFILQLFRFILHAMIRPLTVGLIQLTSDYFCKPFLAVMFNGIIQPPLIFLYNIATSVRDLLEPIAMSIGFFIREISVMCKSLRLVHVDKSTRTIEPQKLKCTC